MEAVRTTDDDVFDYIVRFKRENNGIAPSNRDIKQTLGISSTSEVRRYLERLAADGRIFFPLGSISARVIAVPGYEFREC